MYNHFSDNKLVSSKITNILNRNDFFLLRKYFNCMNNKLQIKQSDKINGIVSHFVKIWKEIYKPSRWIDDKFKG